MAIYLEKSHSFDSRSHSTFIHSTDFNWVPLLCASYVRCYSQMKSLITGLKGVTCKLCTAGSLISDYKVQWGQKKRPAGSNAWTISFKTRSGSNTETEKLNLSRQRKYPEWRELTRFLHLGGYRILRVPLSLTIFEKKQYSAISPGRYIFPTCTVVQELSNTFPQIS